MARSLLLVACLFYSATSFASAGIIYESGTFGATSVPWSDLLDKSVPGGNVKNDAFLGVKFQIFQPVVTTRISGHFVGPVSETFFGAIVSLDNDFDFPNSFDLSTPDVLGYTLLTFPVLSDEVYGDLSLNLNPGWYAMVFGSGLFGSSGHGAALRNNTDIGSPKHFGFLEFFGWGERLPNAQFVVEGNVIPEPTTLLLTLVASTIILHRRR